MAAVRSAMGLDYEKLYAQAAAENKVAG
jgi:hypothetical protein